MRKSSGRGFTLIELLVAITILAVVAVLGWRGLDGIVRARVALSADMEQTRGMQLAFAQLQSDCAQIAGLAVIPDRTPVVADQNRLILVRSVFADNQPTRLQVVVYRLADGVLSRRESAATRDLRELDTFWQRAMTDTDQTPPVELQTGVASMTLRTWESSGAGWRNAGTLATAPGTNPVVLTGLEVTLQLTGRSNSMVKTFLLGAV